VIENNITMKYISELLYNNECVIIPGLGGFISNKQSSKIIIGKNLFLPPSKKILFNSQLSNNDGILANYIAKKENISFKEANIIISQFVSRCNTAFEQKQKIRFPEIGILYKDENNIILFEQDNNYNYLSDSFGLTPFNSPMIKRKSSFERIDKKIKTTPIKQKRRLLNKLKWAAVIVPIMAIGTWTVFNIDYIENKYTKYAVYFAPITGDTVAKSRTLTTEEIKKELIKKKQQLSKYNVNTTSILGTSSRTVIDAAAEEKSITTPVKTEEKIVEVPIIKNKIEKTTPINNSDNSYYIITGSFKAMKNANKHINELKQLGFKPKLLNKNKYGFYRVSAISSTSRKKALQNLSLIRDEDFPKAWLCRY